MELNLQRPLLFFDLESTGLNIATDGIIEISFVKALPGVSEPQVKTWKVKPWDYARRVQIPITPGASAVNGVKDEDLKDCPRFIEILPEVAGWLKDSDLAGFNSAKFDLKPGQLEVSAQDLGFAIAAYEKTACDYAGEDLTIGFKSSFLTDILCNKTCESAVMKFADARRAVLIVPSEEETESEKICGILMPIMI